MKAKIELMARAFAGLEALPQSVAFEIVSMLDHLGDFPKMGAPLGPRFPRLKAFRQLVYRRAIRMIYEFDENENVIFVLAIQDCRQKLPTARDLKRDSAPDE